VFYRWLHKSWKYFWGIVISLLLVLLILAGGIIGILQLDSAQDYLSDRIEQQIERSYKADLTIGEIDGFLPFQISFSDVVLRRKDSVATDTLATIKHINSEIDIWGLLRNKITITGFSVQSPQIWLHSDRQGKLRFLDSNEQKIKSGSQQGWLSDVEVVAPEMEIADGAFYVVSKGMEGSDASGTFYSLTNLNARFFVDWSERQRYLDIESFSAKTKNLKVGDLSFSGQVYSDQQFLEFNSFYVSLGESQFILNGEIQNVNLLDPDFTSQLLAAKYNLGIQSDKFYLYDLRDLLPNLPDVNTPLTMEVKAEGTADSLWLDRANVSMGESFANFDGFLEHIDEPASMNYQLRINRVNFKKQEVEDIFGADAPPKYQVLRDMTVEGEASGSADSVHAKLDLESPLGQLSLQGESRLKAPFRYHGELQGKNLDISSFASATFDTTALNLDARLDGTGITLEDAVASVTATLTNSRVDKVQFDKLELSSSLDKGYLKQSFDYVDGDEFIRGSGSADFSSEEPKFTFQGNAQNVNLEKIVGDSAIASTKLNFDYNLDVSGLQANRIQGRANFDVKKSVIGTDTVRAHQLYMDLDSPDQETRTFRLTSSLFDMNLSGQIRPTDIADQVQFWASYLKDRFHTEVLMDKPAGSPVANLTPPASNIVLDGQITAKDLGLIKHYLPGFPSVETDTRLNFNVNTDGTRMLLSAEIQADTLLYNDFDIRRSRTQFTASFRSDRSLKEFSSVDFQTNIAEMQLKSMSLDSMGINLSVKQDSVQFTQHVGSVSNNAQFDLALQSVLRDSSLDVSIEQFFLGNDEYAWGNEGNPGFIYRRNGNVDFHDFSFSNNKEFFRLQGTLSKNRSDSLNYTLRDINLSRISKLINGEVTFAGILNGTLMTRSLTRQPTIQGDLGINRFALNDRIIGDVDFSSKYNPAKDRFDTQINILTDSSKYENYLEKNDDIGQDIRLDGYFVTPNPDVKQDSLFYFDADFRQIDMWIIPLIVKNIFQEMEGQATGEGYVTGNLEDFDFHADFQTENIFAKPRFVNTNYFINGHVGLDRQDGVILDSLRVMDTKGGTGTVWGTVDLNDFKPITYLDLSIDMDRLQFLNNNYDPEVPFYGSVSGSGVVRLTGSNTDLYMRTESPIQLTNDSNISIPLLEETELNETGKFIRFVDSFENLSQKATPNTRAGSQQLNEDQLEEAIKSMTFSERFDLDLQFDAQRNVTVNLIFDPVTGEILTAQGTGQIRITMQDQDVQMFGRYNINGGNYQFVTGEIISRKLQLEPGGNIIWEGPPDNARLDISAVYRARPNISSLLAGTTLEQQNQNGGQQIPVELIVEINGTLNSVENNYYFQLPSSIDLSSNSTLQYTINQINRDDQQKLLQVVSIFITGQFIPMEGTGGTSATASLSQNLTRGSSVLNPILSNQVISPLLSNQINALLNSDVSRLDVDFNLNAYNEVDLGIALRLYNDRLILRREGTITGSGSQNTIGDRIGDLNATYRIRRGLSITAFHRQDQILSNYGSSGAQAGDVTPNVDGLGLEAQVQYNTWRELLDRVKRTFNSIFGGISEKQKKSPAKENEQEATEQE